MYLLTCPCRVTASQWTACSRAESPSAVDLRSTVSVCPVYCDTQVWVCKCISDNKSKRKSDALFAKFVVGVDISYSRRNDKWRACALAWVQDSRRCGTMSLLTCPCPFSTPLWVGCNRAESPSAGDLRATVSVCPVYCDTQVWVCKCISDNKSKRKSDCPSCQSRRRC